MSEKYYLIDFTASTGGTVRVKAKNRHEAWAKIRDDQTWLQVDEFIDQTKTSEFDINFDKRSMTEDEDQDNGPGQDEKE